MSTTIILEACLSRLASLELSPALPIAWPGIHFDPPDTGMWLEAKLFPNEPLDPSWNNDACHMARGFFQVIVGYRPGVGQVRPLEVAAAICAHFGKGLTLGPVRVRKAPWPSPEITDSDKLLIPVTIPYGGFTQ